MPKHRTGGHNMITHQRQDTVEMTRKETKVLGNVNKSMGK